MEIVENCLISIPPEKRSKEVYYHLARLFHELGKYENAFEHYLNVINCTRHNGFNKEAEVYFNLGFFSANGRGTQKNFKNAAIYYENAAALGNTSALNNLGVLYKNGHGVAMNNQKAKELFTKAAQLGNKKAKQNLEQMLEKERQEKRKTEQNNFCVYLGRTGENFDHYPSYNECPTWDNPYDPWR